MGSPIKVNPFLRFPYSNVCQSYLGSPPHGQNSLISRQRSIINYITYMKYNKRHSNISKKEHTKNKRAASGAAAVTLYDVLLPKVLTWLLIACKGHKGLNLSELQPLLTSLSSVFSTRGLTCGFTFVKSVRGNFFNFLSGNKEVIPGVKLFASGIPRCFGTLLARKLEQQQVPTFGLQLIVTVLMASRGLKQKNVVPDISSIVDNLSVESLPNYSA